MRSYSVRLSDRRAWRRELADKRKRSNNREYWLRVRHWMTLLWQKDLFVAHSDTAQQTHWICLRSDVYGSIERWFTEKCFRIVRKILYRKRGLKRQSFYSLTPFQEAASHRNVTTFFFFSGVNYPRNIKRIKNVFMWVERLVDDPDVTETFSRWYLWYVSKPCWADVSKTYSLRYLKIDSNSSRILNDLT